MGEADAADWEGKEHTSYQGQLNRHAARMNAVQVWGRFADLDIHTQSKLFPYH